VLNCAAYLGSLCCYFPCLVFSLSVTACNFSCCYSCSDVAAYLGSLVVVCLFSLSCYTFRPGYGLSWGLLSNLVNPIVNSFCGLTVGSLGGY
jgi:hypothetical protein